MASWFQERQIDPKGTLGDPFGPGALKSEARGGGAAVPNGLCSHTSGGRGSADGPDAAGSTLSLARRAP